jgi:hypothetical protein
MDLTLTLPWRRWNNTRNPMKEYSFVDWLVRWMKRSDGLASFSFRRRIRG